MPLCSILDDLGFSSWFKKASGAAYTEDPWVAFRLVQSNDVQTQEQLRPIIDLFIRNEPQQENVILATLGEAVISWLASKGVISLENGKVHSKFCLLSSFDDYLLIDWPTRSVSGRLVSSTTYLSSISYDCVTEVMTKRPTGRALDLGCGSGLIVMSLGKTANQAFGIDIDPIAVKLARLNLELNDINATILEGDFMKGLPAESQYDFILANPVYRIIPQGVAYPNPLARVGLGADGLDRVRHVLGLLPKILAVGGKAILRFDVPVGAPEADALYKNPTMFLGPGFTHEYEVLRKTSIEEQIKISVDNCAHLNRDVDSLTKVFEDHYKAISATELVQLKCIIYRN